MTLDDLIRKHSDPGRYDDLPEMTMAQYQSWLADMADLQAEYPAPWIIECNPIGLRQWKVTINGAVGFVVLG